jgi:hypothetical protein
MTRALATLALAFTFAATAAIAQEKPAPSDDEIARELSNPNTALASLTLKNQFRWFEGELPHADEQFSYTMLFQPSFPFPRRNGDKVFFRPAFPLIIDQPIFNPKKGDFDSKSGLGDIFFDLSYAPASKPGLIFAAGLVAGLPTAANDLGTDRWTVGPEVIIGKLTTQQIAVVFPSHQWDYAGSGNRSVNITSIQLGYVYLPGGGWNIGSGPIITYDWDASQWTIPINVNLGRTITFAGSPWRLSTEINYYVDRPDAIGNEWMIGLNITPVVKNYVAGMLNDLFQIAAE